MISTAAFLALSLQCAPDIHQDTLLTLAKTESGLNQYAVSVVGGEPLTQQPKSEEEARSAISILDKAGLTYSLGLTQVYVKNLSKEELSTIFDPCTNIKKGAEILKGCYSRALAKFPDSNEQKNLLNAFSCYYSNNFTRGYKKENIDGLSYVDRIVKNNVVSDEKNTVPKLSPDQSTFPENPIVTPQPTDKKDHKKWDIYQDFNA
ncbi:lytic transglycosylase domain-containing protein [Salmonella enterica subsp. enterica serovar Catumagos]